MTPAKRKIWEIESCYKCALIGTCLNRAELRRLSREKVYEASASLDDYQLHVHFIKISDQNDAAGKALHKYLDKKYRAEFKKYLKAATEAELVATWDADIAEGRVDSAWWSVMIHATIPEELVVRLYGQLHMLSHDLTNNGYRYRQQIASLKAKTDMLEEVIGSERQFFRQEKRRLAQENNELRRRATDGVRHAEEHRRQQDEMDHLRKLVGTLQEERRTAEEQQLIDELRQSNNGLYGRVDELGEEIIHLREELAQAKELLGDMQKIHRDLARHEAEQAREIAALESLLVRHIEQEVTCSRCADQHTTSCPGLSLCGKTVLYVGGLHNMIPHYRQLVEQCGGRFLHHDGGKEASRTLLPKMLTTADAVLCPIDCVSHDACNCVKKMCKKFQKPFVLMRSAGLSSLAKGLSEIVH